MSNSVDSVRILSEAIELAEMLEVLAQNQTGGNGEFPIGGVRLTLRQVTENMRVVRGDLLHERTSAQSVVPEKKSETVTRGTSSVASRLKPAPTMTGRVRDIPLPNNASTYSSEQGTQ